METAVAAAIAALPDDVLAAILGRLPAHTLAASRCVCAAWRAVVDGRRLLLPHLLPHRVDALLVNYVDYGKPHFFARPGPATKAAAAAARGRRTRGRRNGWFSFVTRQMGNHCPWYTDCPWYSVTDHCNGLVLLADDGHHTMYACNPATRRWARLPPCSGGHPGEYSGRAFLVFDPRESRHYRVFLVPHEPERRPWDMRPDPDLPPPAGTAEWPPSRWTWHVFSSRSGRWRETVFVREGEAAGMFADLRMDSLGFPLMPRWRYAAYLRLRGALYVHCHGEYVARLSLSNGKYRVIKSPIDRTDWNNGVRSFLGRSDEVLYFVAIYRWQLRVWILNELHDKTEWILKHDRVLNPSDWWGMVVTGNYQQIQRDGPWILDDYYDDHRKGKSNADWSSDDDDIICPTSDCVENDDYDKFPDTFNVLGFHPYKEVIFFVALDVAVAYHLNTSKVQFLGILKPDGWNQGVYESFVYTPCIRTA